MAFRTTPHDATKLCSVWMLALKEGEQEIKCASKGKMMALRGALYAAIRPFRLSPHLNPDLALAADTLAISFDATTLTLRIGKTNMAKTLDEQLPGLAKYEAECSLDKRLGEAMSDELKAFAQKDEPDPTDDEPSEPQGKVGKTMADYGL